MSSTTSAAISLAAITSNLAVVRKTAPRSKVMAVIKADAYGHGLVPVAAHLDDVDGFGVARLNEAQALRSDGIAQPITLLGGFLDEIEMHSAADLKLDVVVHSPHQLALLQGQHFSGGIWVKVNSGMNRLGFPIDSLPKVLDALAFHNVIGIMSHLASADSDREYTRQQIDTFLGGASAFGLPLSLANSAGILDYPDSHLDWVRPGLMLYGVSPFAAQRTQLTPAMMLSAPVIAINNIPAGEKVGYGGTWIAEKASKVAVLATGYADGYPREITAPVLLCGQRRQLAGRIAMDMTCIALHDTDQVAVGDQVVLWGGELPIEEVAELAGTIPYTLMCHVASRVTRQYV
ncbi:MAG: alanine racemase [Pseudomonadales bacterium]|nr:alanine racemase [Pseudomonadales bacterium]